jgi:glycosyltransferase involved in cell wall biosynthesis
VTGAGDMRVRRQPIRILELRSVRGTGGGPEKTILYGAARSDPDRFPVTVCYIRDQRDDVFALDALARSLGVDYVEVVERHSFDLGIWPTLRRLVRTRAIDIVHAHDYKTDLLAMLLARTERVIALATAHGWTGHAPRERWLYYPADRWVLRRMPRVIAVSDDIRDRLIASGSRPTSVVTILNGIDPARFSRTPSGGSGVREELGLAPDAPVIGSVGRLEPQKRYDLLLRAFQRIRQSTPAARLVIVGDGSQRAALDALVHSLGLDGSCILTGHRADIVDSLQAFDLFVQSSDYEGTPNAVLEAMAVEVPVVATTAGGTAQLIEDDVHGRLVAPGDSDVLASAIMSALGDPARRARWARAARRRIESELSFETRMRHVEAICEELITGAGRPARPATAAV